VTSSQRVQSVPSGRSRRRKDFTRKPSSVVEHRRELRAWKVFGAWTNLVDMKAGSTFDTPVEVDGRSVVRHCRRWMKYSTSPSSCSTRRGLSSTALVGSGGGPGPGTSRRLFLTALSWFGLGMLYGWGYCPCTDWHWQVRARLGHRDPPSYIQLLITEVIGIDLTPAWADGIALCTLVVVAILSIVMNVRDRRDLQSPKRQIGPPPRVEAAFT
jgi:hypothetical protein